MYGNLQQHEIHNQLVVTVVPATDLVVSLIRLKKHCRLPLEEDFTDDDELLTIYEKTAEGLVEQHSETILLERTMRLDLQQLPKLSRDIGRHRVRLEVTPVTEIEQIVYVDEDDAEHTLSTDYYALYSGSLPPEVWIDPDGFVEGINCHAMNAIQITFKAGVPVPEDESPVPVPYPAQQAILFLVGLFYQKREPIHLWSGKPVVEMPLAYQCLIDSLRWRILL